MKKTFVLIALATFFLAPAVLFAQAQESFYVLEPIPGVTDSGFPSFPSFLQSLFRISLALGAILAVLMLVIGGVQYMGADQITSKEDARDRIRNAVLGLLLLFGSVLILRQINPELLKFKIGVGQVSVPAPTVSPAQQGPRFNPVPQSIPTPTDPNTVQRGPDGAVIVPPGQSAAPYTAP